MHSYMYPHSDLNPLVARSKGYYTHDKYHSCNNDVVKYMTTHIIVCSYVYNSIAN